MASAVVTGLRAWVDRDASVRAAWLDCGLIALVWLIAAVLLRPFQDAPFIDDWVYAFVVRQLLETGQLRFLDYCSSPDVPPIILGWLFCLPLGLSYTALRVSTYAVGLAGLWAMYLLLRDLTGDNRRALLGAAILGANPVYFILSCSFMTDVPLVAAMLGAAWAAVRAVRQQATAWLLAATAIASLGCAVRLPGAVVPIAIALVLLLHTGTWGRSRGRWLILLIPLAITAGAAWLQNSFTVHVVDQRVIHDSIANRVPRAIDGVLQYLPAMSLRTALFLAGTLGVWLLPLGVAALRRQTLPKVIWLTAALVLLAIAAKAAGQLPAFPLSPGFTWSWDELGATSPLVPGYLAPQIPLWLGWATILAGFTTIAALIGNAGFRASWRQRRPETALLLWITAGHVAMVLVLWFFYDRYALPLFAAAIPLALATIPAIRAKAAWALVAAFAAIALIGTANHLRYNSALWQAADRAFAMGIRPNELDGGYVVNGAMQYAQPSQAARDASGQIAIPYHNARTTLPYRISAMPEGEVLASFPYQGLLSRGGTLYLVKTPQPPP